MSSTSVKKHKKNKDKKDLTKGVSAGLLSSVKGALARSPVKSAVAISVLVAVLVNALVGLFVWQVFVVQEKRHQLEAFAEQNARVAAANVANYMYNAHKKLEYFQHSASLVTALRYKDPAGILEIERALKNSFPQAHSIRIFAKGQAKVNLQGDPPLRFSEVEIIRKAERREKVIPEAISVAGSDWQMSIVAPVAENDTKPVLGTVLVTLPMNGVYEQLRKGLEGLGKISLYQVFENKPRLIASFGNGGVYKAPVVNVSDSPWRVEFTASESLYDATKIDVVFLTIVGVLVSLASLALFIFVGVTIGRSVYRKQQALNETHRKMGSSPHQKTGGGDALLDVELLEGDKDLLALGEHEPGEPNENLTLDDDVFEGESDEHKYAVVEHIFRCYDIRGLAETEITTELAADIGRALASEAMDKGEKALIIARDARTHSPILMENLVRGVLSTGCKVINIGTVPTPIMYFAAEILEETSSGVMVTASHSPAEFNGFKIVMNGQPRTEADIKAVRSRILRRDFRQGIGSEVSVNVVDRYVETIFSDVALASEISVVIDAGSGVTGKVAPRLFEELGCEVIPLYCDLDGRFPHHSPDPSVEANLRDLIKKVDDVQADLGVAFDGDGDRLAVVTSTGEIIWPDRLLMLFAKDILARNPGADVVFDVKSSRQLNQVISSHGGRPIMSRTGHAPMRAKMVETGALLGGEFSGHIFIKDRWFGFDDGMYAAARLMEIMSLRDENLDEIFSEFEPLQITPEYRFPVPEDKKFGLIDQLVEHGEFGEAKVITLDGVRIEFPYGWGLVRASNTGAEITMRFEAETSDQIHDLKSLLTRELRKVDPSLNIRW